MIKISVTDEELKDACEMAFPDVEEEQLLQIIAEFKRAFWTVFTTPFEGISQKEGVALPVIYAYTEVKQSINKMNKDQLDFLELPEEVFKTFHTYFRNYTSWSIQAAPVIILADQKITKIYKEHFPNG